MFGETIARVIASDHPDCAEGDIVLEQTGWRTHKLNNVIQNSDQDQFPNGQSNPDLRVNSDARETETQRDVVNALEQHPGVSTEEFPAPIGKLLGLSITRDLSSSHRNAQGAAMKSKAETDSEEAPESGAHRPTGSAKAGRILSRTNVLGFRFTPFKVVIQLARSKSGG
jgi:hypothetical protein